jgi:hypothetical protein
MVILSGIGFTWGFTLSLSFAAPTPSPSSTPDSIQLLTVPRFYLPLISRSSIGPTPPLSTTSLYMSTTDSTTLYNLGESYGAAGKGNLVILDFGKPLRYGSTQGTKLFDGSFASISAIESATKKFLSGWWYGYQYQGGSDISPQAVITLTVGTSNCGTGGVDPQYPCIPGGDYVSSGHALAWAQMVGNIQTWIKSPPTYEDHERVAAGSDMEPGWNYSSETLAWVGAYSSYFTDTVIPLYNYGSCDGCSYVRSDWTICSTCTTMTFVDNLSTGPITWSWTLTDVQYISWGALPAYPVPEIYRTDGKQARQWYGVSRFSYDYFGVSMRFKGSVTEAQSCGSYCDTLGNPPAVGWQQLWDALYDDPVTRQTSLPWSTDFKFQ